MTIAVCLCGMPQSPNIGGVQWGRTPNWELSVLHQSLESSQQYLADRTVVDVMEAELTRPESWQALSRRLKALEAMAGANQSEA
ncbi:MAG: hypothetical protein ABSH56_09200 [Bryobacteraceae bacterium]